jgi:glycosyltransferase involved in cell wall biosynthesis
MSVLLISPAGTGGWRTNEAGLTEALSEQGVDAEVRRVGLGRFERFRHPWATGSLIVAWAARRELKRGLRQGKRGAVIAVNSTAAMLFPFRRLRRLGVRVAIRIDCPASEQFPGGSHALHRRLERRALGVADLVLTMGPQSTRLVRPLARQTVEVPLGVAISSPAAPADPPVLVAYAGQPEFKGLDLIIRSWAELGARRGKATLVITGVDAVDAGAFLKRHGVAEPEGVRWAGVLPRAEHDALVAGATAFVSASRLEGYGIAQIEALAAGVPLVTTPSLGVYEAEPLARQLAPELCAEPAALADAIAAALQLPSDRRTEYARRAAGLLAPYAKDRVAPALREALSALGVPAPPGASRSPQNAG